MQMNDTQRIPASKDKVWAALNDPQVLKQCIPGCQNLEMSSPVEMTATVVFRVGPVKQHSAARSRRPISIRRTAIAFQAKDPAAWRDLPKVMPLCVWN